MPPPPVTRWVFIVPPPRTRGWGVQLDEEPETRIVARRTARVHAIKRVRPPDRSLHPSVIHCDGSRLESRNGSFIKHHDGAISREQRTESERIAGSTGHGPGSRLLNERDRRQSRCVAGVLQREAEGRGAAARRIPTERAV